MEHSREGHMWAKKFVKVGVIPPSNRIIVHISQIAKAISSKFGPEKSFWYLHWQCENRCNWMITRLHSI